MLTDRIVMITGAAGGIGRAMLGAFAKRHATIISCTRFLQDDFNAYCRNLENEHNIYIKNITFDITDISQIKNNIIYIHKNIGCPSVVVNNAGILHESLIHMMTLDSIKLQFSTNFISVFNITQLITKLMIRKKIKGSIINISSVAAHDGIEGQSIYGATKAAVEAMSKSVAKELGRYGIRVNCIAPGITKTAMISGILEEILSQYQKNTYLGNLAAPEDIAETAVFLATDASRHITGQVIRVDGGQN